MTSELALYQALLADIKARVRQAQHRAALSANAEMVLMYWDVGRLIASQQQDEGWGTGVIPRLAVDLKNELPEQKGFSPRNLSRMIAFFRAYPILPQAAAKLESSKPAASPAAPTAILPQAAAKLVPPSVGAGSSDCLLAVPWFHHVVLIEKVKDLPTRLWYARQVVEQGWSREDLTTQIKQRAHERQGTAVTNFATTLPELHASLANGLLKDPYLFDFLTLDEPFHERELETGLLTQTKDRILAEYALRDIHKPIGIADYELTRALPTELASSLPSIEAIEEELSRELEESAEGGEDA